MPDHVRGSGADRDELGGGGDGQSDAVSGELRGWGKGMVRGWRKQMNIGCACVFGEMGIRSAEKVWDLHGIRGLVMDDFGAWLGCQYLLTRNRYHRVYVCVSVISRTLASAPFVVISPPSVVMDNHHLLPTASSSRKFSKKTKYTSRHRNGKKFRCPERASYETTC